MLIKNVHVNNQPELVDVAITNGKFTAIEAGLTPKPGEQVIEGNGKLLLPPFIDSHVHLDATLTAGQPEFNESGTLFDGIRIWSERKKSLTKEDVKKRAKQTIMKMVGHGIQHVRSHVDVTDPHLIAAQALLELKHDLKDQVDLQLVAFPQEGIESYPNGRKLLEDAVRMGADCVGAIPHYEFTREYSVSSLNYAVALAEKYDKLVDVHCDEIDDEASRGLETLAAAIGEEAVTIEDVYEPYLMQIGFLSRTPRGRCVTHAAYLHLGLTPPGMEEENQQRLY